MNVELHRDLYGKEYHQQTGGLAGEVAAKRGLDFEKLVAEVSNGKVKTHQTAKGNITFTSPIFTNWTGSDNREGDLILSHNSIDYHVECKNLGGVESHLQKLSEIYCNLLFKSYNLPFILVYTYNSNISLTKISQVEGYLKKIREVGGLVFEFNQYKNWINVKRG